MSGRWTRTITTFTLALAGIVLISWLRLKGEQAGWYSSQFGVSLMAGCCMTAIATILFWNAHQQERLERVRRGAADDERFLAALTELIHATVDPEALFVAVSERMGAHLKVTRCYFADIDVANDLCTINRDYHDGLASIVGTSVVSSYKSNVASMRLGRGVVNVNTELDPRSASRFVETFQPLSMVAYVSTPHLRDGEWVGSLVVSVPVPRVWLDHEVGLLRTVSERTWLWIEHLRLVAALRASEARLAASNAELEGRVQTRTAQLTGTLKERDVMLQEIHHRVKNNLQVISSLINIQARKLEPGVTRDALAECQTRVLAIALIHEKLYESKDYAQVQFADYARSLAANVFHASGISQHEVGLELAIDDVPLSIDRAIPCGLVINELISNALKHGFPDGRAGTIRVELAREADGAVRLTVRDDGIGLPAGFDVAGLDSMGLALVTTLADQLDGVLAIDGSHGAAFHLTFPGSV